MRAVRRFIAPVVATGAALLSTLVSVQPAQAATGVIGNEQSGLCLQPVPDSFPGHVVDIYANGIPVEQVPCNGSTEQQWEFVFLFRTSDPAAPGGFGDPVPLTVSVYYVINSLTGKCMDFTDANSADGTPVQQYDCNGGNSEKWFAHFSHGSWYKYLNYRTHKCLDVPQGTTDQAIMQEYHCFDFSNHVNAAQTFQFPAAP